MKKKEKTYLDDMEEDGRWFTGETVSS